jgi:hypothetical protein
MNTLSVHSAIAKPKKIGEAAAEFVVGLHSSAVDDRIDHRAHEVGRRDIAGRTTGLRRICIAHARSLAAGYLVKLTRSDIHFVAQAMRIVIYRQDLDRHNPESESKIAGDEHE